VSCGYLESGERGGGEKKEKRLFSTESTFILGEETQNSTSPITKKRDNVTYKLKGKGDSNTATPSRELRRTPTALPKGKGGYKDGKSLPYLPPN